MHKTYTFDYIAQSFFNEEKKFPYMDSAYFKRFYQDWREVSHILLPMADGIGFQCFKYDSTLISEMFQQKYDVTLVDSGKTVYLKQRKEHDHPYFTLTDDVRKKIEDNQFKIWNSGDSIVVGPPQASFTIQEWQTLRAEGKKFPMEKISGYAVEDFFLVRNGVTLAETITHECILLLYLDEESFTKFSPTSTGTKLVEVMI